MDIAAPPTRAGGMASWRMRVPAWTGVGRARHAWHLLVDDGYRRDRQRQDPWHLLYALGREQWEHDRAASGTGAHEPADDLQGALAA